MRWRARSDNVSYQPWLPRLVPPVPALQLTPRQGDGLPLLGSGGGDRRPDSRPIPPGRGRAADAPPPDCRAYGGHERRGEVVWDDRGGRVVGWLYSGVLESLRKALTGRGFRIENDRRPRHADSPRAR